MTEALSYRNLSIDLLCKSKGRFLYDRDLRHERHILHPYQLLKRSVRFRLLIGDKMCNFISLHSSPSQSKDPFQSFEENLEVNLESVAQNNRLSRVVLRGIVRTIIAYNS